MGVSANFDINHRKSEIGVGLREGGGNEFKWVVNFDKRREDRNELKWVIKFAKIGVPPSLMLKTWE